jgi:energy-coupling factor transport system permease protein
MTSDKLMYLFGRTLPGLSLIFSMALRFLPRFKEQSAVISEAQRGVSCGVGDGGLAARVRRGMRILSILLTWALENAVETADSMRARGYGLRGRTSFSLFRFDDRDGNLLLGFAILVAGLIIGIWDGWFEFQYFPFIWAPGTDIRSLLAFTPFACFSFLPAFLRACDAVAWRRWEGKMEKDSLWKPSQYRGSAFPTPTRRRRP